jgi:hypothetical protein
VTFAAGASGFPIGDIANYRPMYFSSTGLTTGGTIKVSHTSIPNATAVSFTDGASLVQIRSNSYWTVSTGNGIAGSGTPISVRTEGTGFGVIGNVADLRLTLVSSAAPGTAGVNAGTVANPQVNRTGLAVASLANTYYWGSVNPGYTILPVNLVSFTAQPQTGNILLNWLTAAEGDCSYFSLERSADGANYTELARLPAAGGPDWGHQYLYTDNSPGTARNYYRLKMVSHSGAASYSGVVVANLSGYNSLVLFPNPSNGKTISARVNTPGGGVYSVDVYNDQGTQVRHFSSSEPLLTLRFSPALAPGVYIARVSAPGYTAVGAFLVKK